MSEIVNCRQKIQTLKAVQWDGSGNSFEAITKLVEETEKVKTAQKLSLEILPNNSIKIETFSWLPFLAIGDWLLLDEENRLSVVFKDRFDEVYELF